MSDHEYTPMAVASAAAQHAQRNVTAADKAEKKLPNHLSYEWLLLESTDNGLRPMPQVLEPHRDVRIYRKVDGIYVPREEGTSEAFEYRTPCRLSKFDITELTNLARFLGLPSDREHQLRKLETLAKQRKAFLAGKKAGIKENRRRERLARYQQKYRETVDDSLEAIRKARVQLQNAEIELEEWEEEHLHDNDHDDIEGIDPDTGEGYGVKSEVRDFLSYEQISRIKGVERAKQHKKKAKKIAAKMGEIDQQEKKVWVNIDSRSVAKQTKQRKPKVKPIQQTTLQVSARALSEAKDDGYEGPGNSYEPSIHNVGRGPNKARRAKKLGVSVYVEEKTVQPNRVSGRKPHQKEVDRVGPFQGPSRRVNAPRFPNSSVVSDSRQADEPIIATTGSHGELTEWDGVQVHHRQAPSGTRRYLFSFSDRRMGGRHRLTEGEGEQMVLSGPTLTNHITTQPSWMVSSLVPDPSGTIEIIGCDLAGTYTEQDSTDTSLLLWRNSDEPYGLAMAVAEVLSPGSYYRYDVESDGFSQATLDLMLRRMRERVAHHGETRVEDLQQLLALYSRQTARRHLASGDSFEQINGANGEYTGTDGHRNQALSGTHGEWTCSDDVKTKGVPKKEISRRRQQSTKDKASQERGSYRSLGARLGGAAGKAVAGKKGAKIGRLVGHGTQQLFGRGTYSLQGTGDMSIVGNNTLPDIQDPFDFATDTQGDIILSRSEYVCKIYAPPADAYSCLGISINPGLPTLAPMMAQMAPNFQQYVIEQMAALFRPVTGLVTSGAMGQITMAYSYNPADTVPETVLQLKGYTGQVTFTPIQRAICGLECDPRKLAVDGGKYIRSGAVPEGQDIKTYDTAILWVGAYNINSTVFPPGSTLGELSIVYRVRLIKPRIFDAIGLGIPTDSFWSSSSVSATNVFGTQRRWSPDCTIGGTVTGNNFNTYVFPDGFNGTVLFTIISTGAQTTFTSAVLGSTTVVPNPIFLKTSTATFGSDCQGSTAAGNSGYYMLSVKVATPAVSGTNTVQFIIASGAPTGVMLIVTQINPGIVNPASWEP